MRLFATNTLFSFIVGALSLLVPLYLLQLNVDLGVIGLILSLVPLTFLTFRVLFAGMADEIGTKTIAILYAVLNIIAIGIYMLSISPLWLGLAAFVEGIRQSGFWAVVRTEIIQSTDKERAGDKLSFYSAARTAAEGLGKIALGAGLVYLSFQNTFFLILSLSIVLLLIIVFAKGSALRQPHFDRNLAGRMFKRRPKTFWEASFLMMLLWLPLNILTGFLLPVYFKSGLGLGFVETGTLIAVLLISVAGAQFVSMHWHFHKRSLVFISSLLVPALLILPSLGMNAIPFIILAGIGMAAGQIVTEYITSDQALRSKDLSSDIAVLFVPLKFAEFIALAVGGVLIERFGFSVLFYLCAMILALFVILASTVLKPRERPEEEIVRITTQATV